MIEGLVVLLLAGSPVLIGTVLAYILLQERPLPATVHIRRKKAVLH